MTRTTTSTSNRQHALPLALFWYRLALLSSRSAWRVSVATFCTLPLIVSSVPPCSCTICATSLNNSFSSPTLCSIFLISASRSTIKDSWKSTSSWEASRSCSCSCCCGSSEYWGGFEGSLESIAVRAADVDARCFSRARRCIDWNSVPEDWNSRDSFCWVYFWEACDVYQRSLMSSFSSRQTLRSSQDESLFTPSPTSLNPSLASSSRSCTLSRTLSVSRLVPSKLIC